VPSAAGKTIRVGVYGSGAVGSFAEQAAAWRGVELAQVATGQDALQAFLRRIRA